MSSASRARRHTAYAAVITALAVIAGYKGVIPVFRSHLMEYLGIGDARLGLLFSVGSLAGIGSVLFGGQLIDRYGPRRVIRVCLTGIGCAMLVIALAGRSFYLFVAAYAVSGLFAPSWGIAVSAYLAKLFPRHRRRVISLNLASTSIGGMMFPAVAEGLLQWSRRSAVVAFRHVLHLPFLLTGALIIGAVFLYRRRRNGGGESESSAAPPRRWQWRDLLLPPRALWLAVLIALHGTADSTLHIWMPRFLESESFAGGGIAPGFVLMGYSFAYLLARGSLAALPDRIGRRAFMVLPGLIGGGLLLAMMTTRSHGLTATGYVLGGFIWSVEYPAMASMLMHYDKKRFGAAMAFAGLLTAVMMFAMMNIVGSFVQFACSDRMWMVMLAPAGAFCLVGLGGLAWLLAFDRDVERQAVQGATRKDSKA